MSLNRKKAGLAAAVAAALLLAGCGGGSGSSETSTSSSAPGGDTGTSTSDAATGSETTSDPGTSDTPAAQGGTMRVVLAAEPPTLNPVFSIYSNLRVLGGIFDPLVGFDKQTLEPDDSGLFTEWERTTPTEWTFTLRDGVTFHDGEKWDPAAAIFTLEKYRDEEKSGFRPYHARVTGLEAVGDNQVKVTTALPYIALPKVFTTAMGVSPKAYGSDGDAFGTAPVGTGPFKFSEQVSGQSLTLVANPDYFNGAPALDSIQYSWAADASTRVALLQSGGADIVYDLQVESIDAVDGAEGTHVVSAPSLYKMMVSINTNTEPMSDVRLREALQLAIDYDSLVNALFGERGAKVSPLFAGDVMGITPELTYQQYDPEKAKALVAEVGGTPTVRYLYTTGYYPKDKQVGEAISAMLEDVGFKVEQVPLENSEMRKERNTGNYSIYMAQNFPVFAHPDAFYAFFSGTNASVPFCNEKEAFDALNEQALTTTDQQESDETYVKIEQKFLDESRCGAVLYDQMMNYGISDKVQGFTTALDAVPPVYSWSLAS